MVQVLTFSEGRVSVALIPDRLRSLLADDLETQKKKVAVIADYLPPQGTTSNNDEISDRLTLLSLPKHAGREEFLVRFQRGRAVWMVLVYGARISSTSIALHPVVLTQHADMSSGCGAPVRTSTEFELTAIRLDST